MQEAINKLRERRRGDEEGFTLIELMVVVLIIAILLAIAIPTFLGARKRAQDRAAQSSLRNSLTAAKTHYTDTQSYGGASDAVLDGIEPSIDHVVTGTVSTGPKMVSVNPVDASTFVAAAKSAGGDCFAIKDAVGSGTSYAKVTGDCTGTNAATATFTGSW
jgi:type IV pilus assembly protein PilA